MKTYTERAADVARKMDILRKARRRKLVAGTCLCLLAVVLVSALFIPFQPKMQDIRAHAGSPYYDLIRKLNYATAEQPEYKNAMDAILSAFVSLKGATNGELAGPPMAADPGEMPEAGLNGTGNGSYVEVTDNQVQGIIEGDIIKRSDKYIFYLSTDGMLNVYSIAGADSARMGSYKLRDKEESIYADNAEMYLSQDCRSLFLVRDYYWKTQSDNGSTVCITALDVSDVTNITEKSSIYMTGSYLSSRMVDGDLLIMGRCCIGPNINFDDESTFLPQIGTPGNMRSIAADDILAPDTLNSTQYTVVCKLDSETMTVSGSAAFLSYSQTLYVSRDTVYATRSYSRKDQQENIIEAMTQITALDYSGETLTHLGSVELSGSVKNQYSMDEYEGILRVVTSTNKSVVTADELTFSRQRERNVNLYCVDIATMQVATSVEGFAPEGETAESVRFDGSKGYVCTAEVITLTDPVYFFDLSDVHNITYKDTGTIDGYSSSLVNFGNGFLLGIGYNGMLDLKIEIYEETADGVASVCSFEKNVSFSEDYKSYLIDRENQLVGLAVSDWENGTNQYLLLLFDGYELREVVYRPFDSKIWDARAFVADGWLYAVGNELLTQKIW